MRKLIVILAAAALLPATAKAQTYLKANALYYAAGVPNLSAETRLFDKWTFNGDFVYSPWQSINNRPYVIWQIIPEVRFYVKQANKGFYIGAYAAADFYKLCKWDHPEYEIQHGWGVALGCTLGYEMSIGGRWLMDFYVGGGWHHGWYWGEDKLHGGMYARWNRSGEWIPYKAGVAFAYRISKKK